LAWLPWLACLACGLTIVACASKRLQPLDQGALRASQPRTLVVAEHRSPAMTAEGPAKEGFNPAYMLGAIGAVAAAAGDATANQKRAGWMKRCEIEDPVEQIRETVAEALAKTLSLEVLDADRRTKSTTVEGVIKDHPGVDLVLDIRTTRWGIHRVEAESARGLVHFAAAYEGSLQLIDARKSAVVAEGTCSIQFSNGGDPPTIRELLEDDCALLDKGLALSAATCAKRLLTKALGLPPGDP
jgi:hypothetical protein